MAVTYFRGDDNGRGSDLVSSLRSARLILSINSRTLMIGAKISAIGVNWSRGYIARNAIDKTFPRREW